MSCSVLHFIDSQGYKEVFKDYSNENGAENLKSGENTHSRKVERIRKMDHAWKELLPIDQYRVKAKGIMHDYYRKTLTSLYQPLIGPVAYSLYMTLWAQIESETDWSEPTTHHSLMNMMQLNLNEILLARKKLEAIGLLETFVDDGHDPRRYYYLLESPLSPQEFFNDGALNVYLYNKLGHYQFQQVKKQFVAQKPVSCDRFREVTAAFNDVFQSLHPSELVVKKNSEMERALMAQPDEEFIDEKDGRTIRLTNDFDIDFVIDSVSHLLVPKDVFTDELIEAMKKLAYIYKLQPLDMKYIIESTYVKYDEISVEQLRKTTQDWYSQQHNNQLPHLSLRVQPPLHRETATKEPETEEEKAMRLFETISPYEMLERIAGGAKPAASDLKLIESIMFEQKLLPGVVNVLIEYVMRTNDMKLSRAYVEKIAAHWSRKKIKTVKEAMDLARSEHQKYQQWSPEAKRTKTVQKKNERKAALPKWMSEQREEPAIDIEEFERKKKELEARLKRYSQT